MKVSGVDLIEWKIMGRIGWKFEESWGGMEGKKNDWKIMGI